MMERPERNPESVSEARTPMPLWSGRLAVVLMALSLSSCRFLADEFTRLDRAGLIAEPQQQAPTPTADRP